MSIPVFTCVSNRSAGVLTSKILDELQASGTQDQYYFICKGDLLKSAGVNLKSVSGLAAVSDEHTHVILHKDDHSLLVAEALKVIDSLAKVEEARAEVDTLKAQLDQQASEMKGLSRSITKRQAEKEGLEAELKTCHERLRACKDGKQSPKDTASVAMEELLQNFQAQQDATARRFEKHEMEIAELQRSIKGMMGHKKK